MSDPNHPATPETHETSEAPETPESTESFDQLLSEYEREHARVSEDGARQIEGTVVAVTADAVLLDIGFKSEGTLPLTDLPNAKPGDKIIVSVKGPRRRWLLPPLAHPNCGSERLVRLGESLHQKGDHRRHCYCRSQRRPER